MHEQQPWTTLTTYPTPFGTFVVQRRPSEALGVEHSVCLTPPNRERPGHVRLRMEAEDGVIRVKPEQVSALFDGMEDAFNAALLDLKAHIALHGMPKVLRPKDIKRKPGKSRGREDRPTIPAGPRTPEQDAQAAARRAERDARKAERRDRDRLEREKMKGRGR